MVVPVTSCDYDGCWHNGPVTVHFSANDCGGLGVAYTEYSLDNGSTWTQGTSVTISSAGTTTVLYHSVDIVGNVETPKSVTVNIDLAAPTTTATAPFPAPAGPRAPGPSPWQPRTAAAPASRPSTTRSTAAASRPTRSRSSSRAPQR